MESQEKTFLFLFWQGINRRIKALESDSSGITDSEHSNQRDTSLPKTVQCRIFYIYTNRSFGTNEHWPTRGQWMRRTKR